MNKTPLVIFAGGKSSRMQRDKALLPFGDSDTLVEYQLQRLKPYFENIFISTKELKFNFKADFIKDNSKIFAPLIAIKSVFEVLKSDFLALSVDTPFVKADSLIKLSSSLVTQVSFSDDKIHPLIAFYSYSIKDQVDLLIEQKEYKLTLLFDKIEHNKLKITKQESINLNYFNEYNEFKPIKR